MEQNNDRKRIIYPYTIEEIAIAGMDDSFVIGTNCKFTLWSWQKDDVYAEPQKVAIVRVCMSLQDTLALREEFICNPLQVALPGGSTFIKGTGQSH